MGKRNVVMEASERARVALGELGAALSGRFADATLEGLLAEAEPVLDAILDGADLEGPLDPSAPELREGLAMASLWGRRAAQLDVSPSGLLALADALVETLDRVRPGIGEAMSKSLSAVSLEGYVRAREEALVQMGDTRAASAVALVTLAPGAFALTVAGEQEGEALDAALEGVGRQLLDGDARSCLVWAGGLGEPRRGVLTALYGLGATFRLLGVRGIVVGLPEAWRELGRELGLDEAELIFEPDAERASRLALEAAGLELRSRGLLRRLVGGGGSTRPDRK